MRAPKKKIRFIETQNAALEMENEKKNNNNNQFENNLIFG